LSKLAANALGWRFAIVLTRREPRGQEIMAMMTIYALTSVTALMVVTVFSFLSKEKKTD